jgi:hypothetical protein
MEFKGFNYNTSVKQHGIINHYAAYKYRAQNLQHTNIGYIVFTNLVASHICL